LGSTTSDRISFIPKAGNGTTWQEYRSDIEQLINLKTKLGKLEVSDVREEFPESRNTSYLAAIVHELTRTEK
jgi:hypothetical protein